MPGSADEKHRAVLIEPPHRVNREGDGMATKSEQLEPKVIQIENTTIKIYSRLAHMTKEEQRTWYEREWEKGNPVLLQIARAIDDCYL